MSIESEIAAIDMQMAKLAERCAVLRKIQAGEYITKTEQDAQTAKANTLKAEYEAMVKLVEIVKPK